MPGLKTFLPETGITCHECREINDGPPGICGGAAVEEVETYCGDNAVRGCVELRITSGSLFRSEWKHFTK